MTLLHPMVVHFPIALLLTAVALDVTGYILKRPAMTQAGFYCLCLGCIAAIVAYFTGEAIQHHAIDAQSRALVHLHKTAAVAVVGMSGLLILIRLWHAGTLRGKGVLLYFAGAAVLTAAVCVTGWYGGELVYTHGAGVQAVQGTFGPRVQDSTGQSVISALWAAVFAFLIVVALVLLMRWRALLRRLIGLPIELRHTVLDDWSHRWSITRE